MNGFTQKRTCRLIAALVALLGAILLLAQRVAVTVLVMTTNAVQMGFKRYDSFTGRMALNNFEEDQQLYECMKNVNAMLPDVELVANVLLVVSIVLFVVACFGFVFPKIFGRVLVALRLLRYDAPFDASTEEYEAVYEENDAASDGEAYEDENLSYDGYEATSYENETQNVFASVFFRIKNWVRKLMRRFPWFVWAMFGAALLVILGIAFGIRGCSEYQVKQTKKSAAQELSEQAIAYVNAQKAYFNRTSSVGGPKSLKLPDSLAMEYFTYKVTRSRFVATSNVAIGDCPAGTDWRINSSTDGIFFIDLILSRIPPKDTNCVKLLPDFKNIGRKLPKKNEANAQTKSQK